MRKGHKLFVLGVLLIISLLGCGKINSSKSDVKYQLLDGWEKESEGDIVFFTPYVYKVGGESDCDKYMLSSGYIQPFNMSDDWGVLKDGKIEQVYSENHSKVDNYGSIDDLCAPGYLIKADFDLYSAATLEKEKNHGTNISEIDKSAQYWVLYLAKENEKVGYILALNTRNYTKEDMLEWAKTFKF